MIRRPNRRSPATCCAWPARRSRPTNCSSREACVSGMTDGRWRPDGSVSWPAGRRRRRGDSPTTEAKIREGRLRGAEAAAGSGLCIAVPGQVPALTYESRSDVIPTTGASQSHEPDGKCFVCLCEDVTDKGPGSGRRRGFDHIETLKRYSTVGMGPCQGKMCGQTATRVCARAHRPRDQRRRHHHQPAARGAGRTGRPGRGAPPSRRSAARRCTTGTRPHGARWLDAGQWKRPESYGDPAARGAGRAQPRPA